MDKVLKTEGRRWWEKVLVIIANMTTVWQCKTCKNTLPYHPTKGHKLHQSVRDDICETCHHEWVFIKQRKAS